MLTTLRRKFIAIAMCSMTLVLVVIMTGVHTASFTNIRKTSDELIQLIAQNDGVFPMDFVPGENPPNRNPLDNPFTEATNSRKRTLSSEAPFDTRYFTITLLEDGSVHQINTGRIHSVSTKTAMAYGTSLWEKGKTIGFIDSYRYRAVPVETSTQKNATMYIFVNCEREFLTFRSTLISSISICVAGLIIVFLLVVFFSRKILGPVAESYEKQKRFITDASHEIKTPLTIIDANTEILEMTYGESQWTQSTRNQIKRLASLTEKLVFLARMDEASSKPEMFLFSLSDAVQETIDSFSSVADSQNKTILCNIEENVSLKGEESWIRQLISLLLDNAMKYSPDGGEIQINLTSGKNKTLTVWNTTEAISIGQHNEYFERFYREDSSRNSKTGGFGIGLSTAYAIVQAHKGKITAKSEDGASLLITVSL